MTTEDHAITTITAPLDDDELCALAEDGAVTVKVICDTIADYADTHPGAPMQEGHADFAHYLGERITGGTIPGINYWLSEPHSNVYTVRFELGPEVYLRQARKIAGGRARHGQVKHARDRRRAALRRETRAVTIDLQIHNQYELHTDVMSFVHHARIPAPPCAHDPAGYDTWMYEQLYDRCGTGRCKGDSWYAGVITWASDPALIGHQFR